MHVGGRIHNDVMAPLIQITDHRRHSVHFTGDIVYYMHLAAVGLVLVTKYNIKIYIYMYIHIYRPP